MPDLRDDLQAAVGASYTIERELSGGGMSRVFVARDESLQRRIVIKVLSPELAAGVSAHRFQREIRLAAVLQHPHIVPLLAAGEIEAGENAQPLPYYSMPLVEGESLRDRLARGELPVTQAVRVLRDVADALAFAHERGVVHRDVKPENVLLSGDHASMIDFGVARALESSAAANETLTGTGVTLGTPGYMAPEQAAADASADHRVDIYAFGLLAFESLVGEPAFRGRTPQQILAAQAVQRPPSVADLRPATPPALAALVAQCLEKRPADRPQTARDVLRVLESLGGLVSGDSGSASSSIQSPLRDVVRRAKRPAVIGAAALVVAGMAGVGWYRTAHRANGLDANVLAIAPFTVLAPELSMWREGLVDVLSRNFDGLGSLHTISASVVIKGWSGQADPASADALARRTGAGLALFGSLQRTGRDSVRLDVTIRDVLTSKTLAELNRVDDVSHIDRLIDSTTVGLMRMLGQRQGTGMHRLSAIGTKSLPALKEYLAAEHLYRYGLIGASRDSAAAHFLQAVALDSTFALAYHGLSDLSVWDQSGPEKRLRVAGNAFRAAALNHGLGRRDSLAIVVDSLMYATCIAPTSDRSLQLRLFSTLDLLTAEYPSDPDAWYLYAEARDHCGSVLHLMSDRELLSAFDRSIAADSGFSPAYVHTLELSLDVGGPALARRYVEAMIRFNPEFASVMRSCFAFVDSTTWFPERLPAFTYLADANPVGVANCAGWTPDPVRAESLVLQHLETRVREGRLPRSAIDTATLSAIGALAYRGRLAAARRLGDVTRVPYFLVLATLGSVPAETAHVVFDSWRSMKKPPLPCEWIFAWWATHGDSAGIAGCVGDLNQRIASASGPAGQLNSVKTLAGAFFALARSDTVAAEQAFDRVPDVACTVGCEFAKLARARVLAARGRPREALASLQSRATIESFLVVPIFLERARIALRLGDLKEAANSYQVVVAAWDGADPVLLPSLREAQQALAHLPADANAVTLVAPLPRRKN